MSLLVNACDAGDVPDLGVLRHVEVVKHGTRSGDRSREGVDAEALERERAEVLQETLPIVALGEDPVVVVREMSLGLEESLQMVTMLALDEDLLGAVAGDELGEYLIGALAGVKLSRREVEQC